MAGKELVNVEHTLPSGATITTQLLQFVKRYAQDFDGHKAAMECLPVNTSSSARSRACRVLERPEVQEALRMELRDRFDASDASVDMILREFYYIGRASARDLFNPDGSMIPLHRLPKHIAGTVKKFKLEQRIEKDEDGNTVATIQNATVELHSKDTALTRLGQYNNMWGGEEKDGGAMPVEFNVVRST